jgi:hypothetical protein
MEKEIRAPHSYNVTVEQNKLTNKRPLIIGMAEATVSLSKRLITPSSFSDKTVLFDSTALVLFVCFIDIKATESVQLNLLYLFPMFLISVHCTNKSWVLLIFTVGIFLHIFTMILYVDITLSNKILKMGGC